jgi:hypothetical protein
MKDNMFNKLTSEWEPVKHGVPQGLVLGSLLLLIYINDLSQTISCVANLILCADYMSIINFNFNLEEFKKNINLVMNETINWFQSNLLTLNCDKTHFLQFFTKKQNEMKTHIMASNSVITNINNTKFLGLTIDSIPSWREHIVELTFELNKACYAIRGIKTFMTLNVLRTIYFSYFHSVMSYGIIFWGNSHCSNNIFRIQKRIIRIITNNGKRNYNLHLPTTYTTLVQKGVLYSGSRIYNHLPLHIPILSNDLKYFKSKLKNFLIKHTLYSLEKFYQVTST